MEPKKISFGFSKTTKKSNIISNKLTTNDDTVELIKCLEENKIKLVEEKKAKEPLVIPLKNNQTTAAALASLITRRAVLNNEEQPEAAKPSPAVDKPVDGSESLEQRAARELLSEVNLNDSEDHSNKDFVLPILKPDELPLDGAKEPTIDDYEAIPIQEFGRAMLRGMGWVDPPNDDPKKSDVPVPRPKGMGLGADKVLKPKPLLVQPERNEVLEIKRKAFVRILCGKHKDMYGQVEDYDDYAERLIVRMAIGGTMEVFNQFMCQPVAKKEYEQYGRCINNASYLAYKSMENEYGQIIVKKELTTEPSEKGDDEKDKISTAKEGYQSDRKQMEKYADKHDRYLHESEMDTIPKEDERDKVESSTRELKRSRSPHSREQNDLKEQSCSSRHRKYITDSSCSSDSSDSDDRRHKKKSSKSKSTRKSKKSTRRRHADSSDEKHKNHKKKTKKSKRERSRSRSRRR